MTRTSRCAMHSSTDDATRYGSTPMSSMRVTALAASFVCSVEKTRWPVSAARMAMSAVSLSRTSPIIMMSGSWRRNERRPAANVRPFLVLTCTWLMPVRLYSTGSSMVRMFFSCVFCSVSAA
jgi:hypothetical protein